MKTLAKQKLRMRRRFDYRVVQKMKGGQVRCSTHLTAEDAELGRNPVLDEVTAEHAAHFRARYPFRTLTGPGRYSSPTLVRFDASASRYPFTEPTASVVEREGSKIPWSPHFSGGLPVCLGSIWQSNGRVLIAHLIIHVAHLLNWDEQLGSDYGGYNPRAVRWWRDNIGGPLNPDLEYPALPLDELYGAPVARKTGGFCAVSDSAAGGFQAIGRR